VKEHGAHSRGNSDWVQSPGGKEKLEGGGQGSGVSPWRKGKVERSGFSVRKKQHRSRSAKKDKTPTDLNKKRDPKSI